MITRALLALALATPGTVEVSVDEVMSHLQAFQAIADAHGGNRAAGESGYDASADYVAARLRAAGYEVELQPFVFPFYRELSAAKLSGKKAFPKVSTLVFSGSGRASGRPRRAGDGCLPRSFAEFRAGQVAVVQRGACPFQVKAVNARRAGASALVIVNQGGPFGGSLETPQSIPVVGVSAAVGKQVAAQRRVRVVTRTASEQRVTYNVIAQTKAGNANKVVMVGAHLDSVPDGPGINDNASGSAAILELAEQVAKAKPDRAIRFAWWGAEEEGLLGSIHYVMQLDDAARKKIKAYLNLDMIGSPNPTFGIYDGDDSDKEGAGPGPKGSARIERAFERWFTAKGLPYQGTDFSGRSDYGPFIQVGIPAGGLFTGADSDKTAAEAKVFGGEAGKPLDKCYHLPCDSLANVNRTALRTSAEAVAAVLAKLAWRS
ncbi:M28 family metallopeptidase [Nonomuraea sp. NPDC050328]|uniref:M28 family metallopeptidase n=1 Tax=Nonomuraea sp. NPDC050328 TaxID=3364361 RepID=UPI0037996B9B